MREAVGVCLRGEGAGGCWCGVSGGGSEVETR